MNAQLINKKLLASHTNTAHRKKGQIPLKEVMPLFENAGNPKLNLEETLLFCILTGQHQKLGSEILYGEYPDTKWSEKEKLWTQFSCSLAQFKKVVNYIKSRYEKQLPDFPFSGHMCGLKAFGRGPGDHPIIKVAQGESQIGFSAEYVIRKAPHIESENELSYDKLKQLLQAEYTQVFEEEKIKYLEIGQRSAELEQEIHEKIEHLAKLCEEKQSHLDDIQTDENPSDVDAKDQQALNTYKQKMITKAHQFLIDTMIEMKRLHDELPKEELELDETKQHMTHLYELREKAKKYSMYIDRVKACTRTIDCEIKNMEDLFNSERTMVFTGIIMKQTQGDSTPRGAAVFGQLYDNLKTATAQMVLEIDLDKAFELAEELSVENKDNKFNLKFFKDKFNPHVVD